MLSAHRIIEGNVQPSFIVLIKYSWFEAKLNLFLLMLFRKHISLKALPASSAKAPKKSSSLSEHHKDIRVPPIHSVHDSEDENTSSSPLLLAPTRRGPGRPKKAPPVLEPCLPYHHKISSKRMHHVDCNQIKGSRQISRKESESSDQSVERCDKLLAYTTHRSRGEVQVTSQGVQCDQSEFPQLGQTKSKKKKKTQSSRQVSLAKSTSLLKPSTHGGQKKERLHRKEDHLQSVCDRVIKTSDNVKFGSVGQSKSLLNISSKEGALSKKMSPSKQDSLSLNCKRSSSSSSSKRRAPSCTERKKKGSKTDHAAVLAEAAAALLSSTPSLTTKSTLSNSGSQPTSSLTGVCPTKAKRHSEVRQVKC